MPPEMSQVSELSGAVAGIATLTILTLGTIAWRRVQVWLAQAAADLKATKDQTTNGHKTNLRDDVTAIGNGLTALTGQVGDLVAEMREVRKDVRFVTQYARDVDQRLNNHAAAGKKEKR